VRTSHLRALARSCAGRDVRRGSQLGSQSQRFAYVRQGVRWGSLSSGGVRMKRSTQASSGLESGLGSRPHEFESRILRHSHLGDTEVAHEPSTGHRAPSHFQAQLASRWPLRQITTGRPLGQPRQAESGPSHADSALPSPYSTGPSHPSPSAPGCPGPRAVAVMPRIVQPTVRHARYLCSAFHSR
jgi:hypothetical protein